jgi:ADP-heptose:LPS heptosyltransferase
MVFKAKSCYQERWKAWENYDGNKGSKKEKWKKLGESCDSWIDPNSEISSELLFWDGRIKIPIRIIFII